MPSGTSSISGAYSKTLHHNRLQIGVGTLPKTAQQWHRRLSNHIFLNLKLESVTNKATIERVVSGRGERLVINKEIPM